MVHWDRALYVEDARLTTTQNHEPGAHHPFRERGSSDLPPSDGSMPDVAPALQGTCRDHTPWSAPLCVNLPETRFPLRAPVYT